MENKIKQENELNEKEDSSGIKDMEKGEERDSKLGKIIIDEKDNEKDKKIEKTFKRNNKATRKVNKDKIYDDHKLTKSVPVEKEQIINQKVEDGIGENLADFSSNVEGYASSVNNSSKYSNDYSFSLTHFLRTTCLDDKHVIYKGPMFTSKRQETIYNYYNDIYGGQSFKNKTEFWAARLQLIMHFVRIKFTLLLKLKTFADDSFNSTILNLSPDEQFVNLPYEELKALLSDSPRWLVWIRNAYALFHTQTRVLNLPNQILGSGIVLKRRSATTVCPLGLYVPTQIQYLEQCITTGWGFYNEIAFRNPATNFFTIRFNSTNVLTDAQIVIRHPIRGTNARINEILSYYIPSYRNFIFMRIRSLISDFIDLKAGHIITNVSQISTSLNIVITNVSAANSIANTVFATNVTDLFLTLAAGSCMSSLYQFTYDVNSNGGFNLTTLLSCFSYLMYVPNSLMDMQTVHHMKTYIWLHLLGCFKYAEAGRGNEVQCYHFRSVDPTVNTLRNAFDFNDAVVGQRLNRAYTTWTQYLANAVPGNGIYEFFAYGFPRIDPIIGFNDLYEGADHAMRFSLCVNLLTSVSAYGVTNGTISTPTKNTIIGFIDVLRNQFDAYVQMAGYMNTCVDYMMSVGINNFGNGPFKYDLPIEPNKLLSMSVKLDSFSADYKMSFHNILAWGNAVKFEIGFCMTLFRYLWSDQKYWVVYLVSNHRIREFLGPIKDGFKHYMTTDIGKWVFDNLWLHINKQTIVPDPLIDAWNLLDLFTEIDGIEASIKLLETNCGYSLTVGHNLPVKLNSAGDLDYILTGDTDVQWPIVRRLQAYIAPDIPTCILQTDDNEFPCFRVRPKLKSGNDSIDANNSVLDLIREGQGVVDIPLYYRLYLTGHLNMDGAVKNPPLILPIATFPMRSPSIAEMTPGGLPGSTVEYYHHDKSDIIFSGSSDLNTIFTVTAI